MSSEKFRTSHIRAFSTLIQMLCVLLRQSYSGKNMYRLYRLLWLYPVKEDRSSGGWLIGRWAGWSVDSRYVDWSVSESLLGEADLLASFDGLQ